MTSEEKEIVRQVARAYLARAEPDRVPELDRIFDAVYRSVCNALAPAKASASGGEPRLPFGPEVLDAPLLFLVTLIAAYLVREVHGLKSAVKRLLEMTESQHALPEAQRRAIVLELADEVRRRTEPQEPSVTPPRGVAPSGPRGSESAERRDAVAPPLTPCDLEIRVTTRDDGEVLVLDYVLHSPNGRFELAYVPFPGGRLRRPDAWQQRIFKTLEKLHRGLDSRDARLTATDVATELAALGEDLSDELFPPELQRTLQEVREAETVLLVSDEPWIPWELVKPYEAQGEDDGFLASRQLTRWLAGGRTPAARIDVERLAVVEAGSPPDLQALTKAADELRFLRELGARHGVEDESLAEADHPRVLALLRERDLGLIHFVGHGEHDEEDPTTSGFHLHDGRTLRPRDLRRGLRQRLGENRSLIFLNACQTGRQGWSLTRPGGWARRFVADAGCGAFVAPQWTVGDEVAHAFAVAFYEALERGVTFGEATLAARGALPEGSPGRLAYAVYAHPKGRLRLGRRAKTSPEDDRSKPLPI